MEKENPDNQRRCSNCGSSLVSTGKEIAEHYGKQIHDERVKDLRVIIRRLKNQIKCQIIEREKVSMFWLIVAVVPVPVLCYFQNWGFACLCTICAVVGIYDLREAAFRDGMLTGSRKDLSLSCIDLTVFCISCGFMQTPDRSSAVLTSAEALQEACDRVVRHYRE